MQTVEEAQKDRSSMVHTAHKLHSRHPCLPHSPVCNHGSASTLFLARQHDTEPPPAEIPYEDFWPRPRYIRLVTNLAHAPSTRLPETTVERTTILLGPEGLIVAVQQDPWGLHGLLIIRERRDNDTPVADPWSASRCPENQQQGPHTANVFSRHNGGYVQEAHTTPRWLTLDGWSDP